MKTTKRIISMILALMMMVSIIASVDLSVYAAATSGTCGDNLTWTLDDSGTLIISGMGEMTDYSYGGSSPYCDYSRSTHPWYESYTRIVNIVIDSGVTTIGNYAFKNCSNVTSVTIPNGLISIGDNAFDNCEGLTSIEIPNDVRGIGNYAFNYCTSLTSVKIPDCATYIGSCAFFNCYSLTSVTIPSGVTTIGDDAFDYCTGLTSVTIPSSVTSIGYYAFNRVNNVAYTGTATGSPWGAKSFNGYVDGCLVYKDSSKTELIGCSTAATSVTISDSVTSIANYAFYNCSSLKELKMPCSAKIYNSNDTFYDCKNIEKVTLTKGTGIMRNYNSSSDNAETFYRYTPWYKSKGKIRQVILEDGITNIGSNAFAISNTLTSINIPSSVTSIGDGAFFNCNALKELTMPCSAKMYNSSDTFYNCKNIEKLTLTKGTGTMQNYSTSTNRSDTYYQYTPWYISKDKIKQLTLRDGITSIGSYSFYDYTGLPGVTLPDSVTSIGSSAFYNVINVAYSGEATGSPWDAKSINGYVDGYLVYTDSSKTELVACSSLATNITIPDSVTSINNYAFYNCSGLTELTMPCSAKIYNSSDTFYNCTNIEKVTLTKGTGTMQNYSMSTSDSDTYYQYTPWYISENKLTQFVLEDGITSIGSYAFYDCVNLASVTIPDSVVSIETDAFYNTALYNDSSNWDSGVLYINNCLIKANTSLSDTYSVKSGTLCIADKAFYECRDLKSVIIPDSVTSIGDDAFNGCSKLRKVTLSDNINSIGSNVFDNTEVWNTVNNWDNGALYIGNHLIDIKSNVTNITVRPTCINLASDALANCESSNNLTEIDFINPNIVINVTIPANAIIGGFEDSTAYDYAVVNNRNFYDLSICTHNETYENIISASCTKTGKKQIICSKCYKLISQSVIPVKEHSMIIETQGKEATCTEDGYTCSGYCSMCDYVVEKTTIKASGHRFDDDHEYCLNSCGMKKSSACKHKYSLIKEEKATCTSFGKNTYKCEICEDETTEYVSELAPHVCSKYSVINPTCTSQGYTVYKCNNCDVALIGDITEETNIHDWCLKESKPATCTENGMKTYTCSNCKESYNEIITALGHTYVNSTIKPTYLSQGYTLHTCSKCGSSYKDTYKNKLVIANPGSIKLTAVSKGFKITYKKVSAATGYQIQYSTSSKFKTKKTVTITKNSTLSKTVKNLTAKKKYYVRIRSYKTVSGKKVYSSWTTKYVTTK